MNVAQAAHQVEEVELIDPGQARLPAAARDVLWLVTCACAEMAPPSNFAPMVLAISGGGCGNAPSFNDFHQIHRTGQAGTTRDAASVAPRAYAAASKARRIERALQRAFGDRWREVAHELAGWMLEYARLPALGVAAGAAPKTHAARVGWSRYCQAARARSERDPRTLSEWLVRLNARARAGKPLEAKLALAVAKEAEELLRATCARLGRR